MQNRRPLKTMLLEAGKMTSEQVSEIEKTALDSGKPFEDILLERGDVSYGYLGSLLSESTGLPYRNLLEKPPAPRARSCISVGAAKHWEVFPAHYDEERHVLNLAVYDPDQAGKIRNIHDFFMRPYSLDFLVASRAEIIKALQVHFRRGARDAAGAEAPGNGRAVGKTTGEETLRKLPRLPKRRETEERRPPAPERKPGPPPPAYQDMSRSVINAVALIVMGRTGDAPAELEKIRARVRYCQLMGARQDLSAFQIDRVVIAAWLFALKDGLQIAKQVAAPYRLEELLSGGEVEKRSSPEADILSLVACYQDLREEDATSARDVALTRRNLRVRWSASRGHDKMLEAFLQILMDEEFLDEMHRHTGRILIIDPAEMSTANMTPPLMRDGYDVHVVAGAEAAEDFIARSLPDLDLVIADASALGGNALDFCRRFKGNADTASIGLFMLMSGEETERAAACLRAGADDVMNSPVNLEILFLKMQRRMGVVEKEPSREGVSGSLRDMGFTDMIQILCAGNKSMKVVLKKDGTEGTVFIKDGSVIHAELDGVSGEKAFYALMRWHEGEFITSPCDDFPEPSISASTMSLLMEGARMADEGESV
ncbi:MAG: DUF4388 domain-containing protein [Kiritimatiellia bacterium]